MALNIFMFAILISRDHVISIPLTLFLVSQPGPNSNVLISSYLYFITDLSSSPERCSGLIPPQLSNPQFFRKL